MHNNKYEIKTQFMTIHIETLLNSVEIRSKKHVFATAKKLMGRKLEIPYTFGIFIVNVNRKR